MGSVLAAGSTAYCRAGRRVGGRAAAMSLQVRDTGTKRREPSVERRAEAEARGRRQQDRLPYRRVGAADSPAPARAPWGARCPLAANG